ncbi:carbohydrate-binding protein [Pelagicoccus sp. NFK12]|uniref:Carbohydrate-binding protein n=1 Tax=Pelagicoccus enzymogenes TaxID=2773457 RepID=A0A927IGP0_9BACT|nr:Ig-like domain-containing protein [Pelagicoccus enzymogenes]MBD5779009.1 carbohydrate-binding protein [Pelagicoccus enzymogenes]
MPSTSRRALACLLSLALALPLFGASQLEKLGRGLVAVRTSETSVYLSWRLLGDEPVDTLFNVYRASGDGIATKLNVSPIGDSTNFVDNDAPDSETLHYYVRAIIAGTKLSPSEPATVAANAPIQQYLRIPLNIPAGGTTPDNVNYSYSANDCSVADLDNDGEYEIIVKWEPSNAKDNSQSGHTGNVILDAYEFDGTQLWRLDLGVNVRAGAHYTQFLAYDFDGDGQAELALRTCEGSKDATGAYIAKPELFSGTRPDIDHSADRRNNSGYVVTGPEFITVFDGKTGAELATTLYVPQRVPGTFFPSSSQAEAIWGDNYGNRMDRFLATVAYLDGAKPSMVFCRGYYKGRNGVPGRTALAAFDWRDGALSQRWTFDTYQNAENDSYRGQGAHSVTVGDVDNDGKDEIVYGACTIDDDGTGLYSTGIGHGDALHLSDMDPSRPGLEIWMPHEEIGTYGPHGSELHDAKTGEVLYSVSGENSDVGRGMAADIDPRHLGYETWASRGGLNNASGTNISSRRPSSINFACYWDGDLLREILDGTTISKWDWENERLNALLSPEGVSSNNSTKATPTLSADLYGDWREEVVWRENDSSALRVYTTTIPTSHRVRTLMHDRQYRVAISWQNTAYNQPPHPSFYLGEGMQPPPTPELELVGSGVPSQQLHPEEKFAAWLLSMNLPEDSDPASDPHGTGFTLLEQYAFALDENPEPVSIDWKQPAPQTIEISTPRDEFDYILQHSDNLQTWNSSPVIMGGPQTVALPANSSTSFASFYRVATTKVEEYNAFPTVTLSSPASGQTFSEGDTITFAAEASDSDGAIANLELLLNGETYATFAQAPFTADWTSVGDGGQELRAIATDNQGAKGYATPLIFYVVSNSSNEGTLYPAETATRVGGVDESSNAGFNGSGYINFDSTGTSLTFSNVDGGNGGSHTLKFRFALGAAESRSGQLTVNGSSQTITFPSTGSWTTWEQHEVTVTLNAGASNTISLSSNGQDLANIDELLVAVAE